MPFRSQAQRAYMYANHPQLAKEFEEATPEGAKLPEHVKQMAFGGETNPKHETVKSMENNPTAGFADGGLVSLGDDPTLQQLRDKLEPGVMDETEPVEQKMLKNTIAALSGIAMPGAVEGLAKGAMGLGEEGMARLGNAPKMEEMEEPGKDGITVFVKGVQKNPNGPDVIIRGVKGSPEMLEKHFGDPNPGSVPEEVLRAKGFLPEVRNLKNPTNAPNSYAYGGEVKNMFNGGDSTQPQQPQQPDFMSVLQKMLPVAASYAPGAMPNIEAGAMTSPALGQLAGSVLPQNLQPSAPTPPAQDTQFMNQLNAGTAIQPPATPQAPSLSQASQTAQNAPSTNYDFYKNMSADDRAALYQRLTQQQHGLQANIGRGVAGLGDAISNSFGHGGAHAEQTINANLESQKQGELGAMDTQRQQKMQDVQARLTMMESDPNSPSSQGMRQFFKGMGIPIASGMSAAVLKGLLPDAAKVYESKLQAAVAGDAHSIDAAKASMGESAWEEFKASMGFGGNAAGEQFLENRISGGSGAKPTNFTHTTPSGIKYGVH